MPDINQLLGNKNPEEPNQNHLESFDQASKESFKEKKTSKDKSLDKDTIVEMLMTGDNTAGMFTPSNKEEKDTKDKLHEEVDEKAEVKVTDKVTPKGKYMKDFKNDMLKNPNDYTVMTPRGEMTVAEAVRKGYNPVTKRFEKKYDEDEIKKKHLEGLNEADRARLEEFTNPASAKVAPKDAPKYNLKEDSPMIARAEQPAQPTAAPVAEVPQEGTLGNPPTSNEGMGINQMLGGM